MSYHQIPSSSEVRSPAGMPAALHFNADAPRPAGMPAALSGENTGRGLLIAAGVAAFLFLWA